MKTLLFIFFTIASVTFTLNLRKPAEVAEAFSGQVLVTATVLPHISYQSTTDSIVVSSNFTKEISVFADGKYLETLHLPATVISYPSKNVLIVSCY